MVLRTCMIAAAGISAGIAALSPAPDDVGQSGRIAASLEPWIYRKGADREARLPEIPLPPKTLPDRLDPQRHDSREGKGTVAIPDWRKADAGPD